MRTKFGSFWSEPVVELKLRGRQRDSFVSTNISQSTEAIIILNGDMMGVYWSRLLCQWYQTVDGVRLSVSQLVEYTMELRNRLLQFCRPGSIKTPSVPFTGHPSAQGHNSNVDCRF